MAMFSILVIVIIFLLLGLILSSVLRKGPDKWSDLRNLIVVSIGTALGFYSALLADDFVRDRAEHREYTQLLAATIEETRFLSNEARKVDQFAATEGSIRDATDPLRHRVLPVHRLEILATSPLTFRFGSYSFVSSIHNLRSIGDQIVPAYNESIDSNVVHAAFAMYRAHLYGLSDILRAELAYQERRSSTTEVDSVVRRADRIMREQIN